MQKPLYVFDFSKVMTVWISTCTSIRDFFAYTKIELLELFRHKYSLPSSHLGFMWNFRYSSLPKLVNFMITPANNSKLQRWASIDTLLWLVVAYYTPKLKPCFALNVLLKHWIAAAFSSRISPRTPLVSLCVEVWGLKFGILKLNDCSIAHNKGPHQPLRVNPLTLFILEGLQV